MRLIMTDQEILQLFLDTQEWQTFECKRAAVQPGRLLETVVAFANTDGGFLVVGLEDPRKAQGEKRPVGISERPDNVSEFLKLIEKEIEPPLRLWGKFDLEIINTQKNKDALLVVNIKKSNEVHSLKKDEINKELLNGYKKDTQSENEDDWQFLKDNGLAVKRNSGFELTKAGVLLFGKNPSVILKSKSGVKISHYYGTKPTYTGEPNFVRRPFTIEGPLIYQINESIKYFREAVKNAPPKLKGGSFRSSLLIPEWAFQEAVTNAVIHRNYFIQDDIQVRFFDDRVEFENPGTYPGHITVGNIRTERFSRNPIIQRTLNRFREAPNLDIGEGVDRMFKVMKEYKLYEPLYFPPSIRPNSVLLFLFNLQKTEYWDTVNKYLNEHYRITNSEARRITGVSDTLKMSRLLKSWVTKGLLEKMGVGFRGNVYYRKPGIEVPTAIFKKQ